MSDIMRIDIVNGKPSVTSLQVAESFGKEHKNVLRDIEAVLPQVSENFVKLNFEPSEYEVNQGIGTRKQPMYILSKDGFTLLTMGYTGTEAMKFKVAYITRFNEMEEELRKSRPVLPDFTSPLEAAEAWIVAERARIAEQARADYYQKTKAEIGSRREATAMATASVAVRKVDRLEDELGRGKRYKAVKAIPWLLDVFESTRGMYSVVGKALKRMSVDLGYNVEKIPCTEYPDGVNAYHVDVIDALFGELRDNPGMLFDYRRDRAA